MSDQRCRDRRDAVIAMIAAAALIAIAVLAFCLMIYAAMTHEGLA